MVLLVFIIILLFATSIYKKSSEHALDLSAKDKIRRKYIIVVCGFCVLLGGFRNLAIGPDTYHYALRFYEMQDWTWQQLFGRMFVTGEKDPLWFIVMKIFGTICPFNRPFLFFVDGIFYFGVGSLVYRNTRNIFEAQMAFLMFAFLFLTFSFTAHRQIIALGVCMYSVRFVQERNFKLFALCMLSVLFIHKSSMLFWPYYFIANIKSTKRLVLTSLIMLPVIFVFNSEFASLLAEASGEERFMSYAQSEYEGKKGAYNYLMMLIAVSLFFISKAKSILSADIQFNYISNSIALVVVLLPLAWLDPSLMRTLMYFSIMMPIVLSRSIASMSSYQSKINAKYIILTFFLVMCLWRWNSYNWTPYWMPTPGGDHIDNIVLSESSFFTDRINYGY